MRLSRLSMGAAALGLALGAAVLTTAAASATATDCVGSSATASCINVQGSGTHVNWIKGGAELAPHKSARGYFKITDASGMVGKTTKTVTLSNNSSTAQTKWGPAVTLNRNLPNGDKVCATFYELKPSGALTRHSPACKTIKK